LHGRLRSDKGRCKDNKEGNNFYHS
jgi:hypothetical protein